MCDRRSAVKAKAERGEKLITDCHVADRAEAAKGCTDLIEGGQGKWKHDDAASIGCDAAPSGASARLTTNGTAPSKAEVERVEGVATERARPACTGAPP
jgi:hypothetical protein